MNSILLLWSLVQAPAVQTAPIRYSVDDNYFERAPWPGGGVTNLVPWGEVRVVREDNGLKTYHVELGKQQETWAPQGWKEKPPFFLRLSQYELATERNDSGVLRKIEMDRIARDCTPFETYPFVADFSRSKVAVLSSIWSQSQKDGIRVSYGLRAPRTGSTKSRVLKDSELENMWLDVLDPFLGKPDWARSTVKNLRDKKPVTYKVFGYKLVPLEVHLELAGPQQVTYKGWTKNLTLLKAFDAPAGAPKRRMAGFMLVDDQANLILGRSGLGLIAPFYVSREDSESPKNPCWPAFIPAYYVAGIPLDDRDDG